MPPRRKCVTDNATEFAGYEYPHSNPICLISGVIQADLLKGINMRSVEIRVLMVEERCQAIRANYTCKVAGAVNGNRPGLSSM